MRVTAHLATDVDSFVETSVERLRERLQAMADLQDPLAGRTGCKLSLTGVVSRSGRRPGSLYSREQWGGHAASKNLAHGVSLSLVKGIILREIGEQVKLKFSAGGAHRRIRIGLEASE